MASGAESEDDGPLRVGIVDDHQFMRMGIEHHFANVPDVEVALSVGDSEELPPAGPGHGLDVLLLDLRLQGGRTTLPAVAQWSARIPVLMMSVSGEERDVIASLRHGAPRLHHQARGPRGLPRSGPHRRSWRLLPVP